jgi:homogentisate phytyltransferase/homogentisate geranylgeranyltransferase
LKKLKTLWQFSRPHTIIGSLVSVTTLFLLVASEYNRFDFKLLFITLIASVACNIFIVGLNQIIDVALDKINKPYLPLAAGKLTINNAKKIIAISFIVSIVFAFMASKGLGALIIVITVIGYIYSAPPIQLKKHHLPAAICITLVRGILVNIGMYLHFKNGLTKGILDVSNTIPSYLYTITIFVGAFSVAIAWFKDLPDTDGDAKFNFKTLAVLYNPKLALLLGSIIVALAYIYCISWAFINSYIFLTIAHSVLFLAFILNLLTIKLNYQSTIKKFYMRFWVFFFAEYILFAVWALVNVSW